MTQEQIDRMQRARHLLTPPGPEVVGECLDEIAQLRAALEEAIRIGQERPVRTIRIRSPSREQVEALVRGAFEEGWRQQTSWEHSVSRWRCAELDKATPRPVPTSFTREDVEYLECVERPWANDLAARIEALLPPEEGRSNGV